MPLPRRQPIDILFNRIHIHYSSVSIEAQQGKSVPVDFVHTGNVVGDWYQFMDEFGLFWSRLDYGTPAGYATVVYDEGESQPVHVWELEVVWGQTTDPKCIPGLFNDEEDI